MSVEIQQQPLAPRIAALLSSLRLRIRGYVWTEGLAAIVVTLGLAFWLSLAFDWLFEPPWQVRAAMLVVTGAAVLAVANRLIFSRVFRPIDDTNLAVVLERRFRDYHDSLLTTVELNTQSAHRTGFNQQMLDDTRRQAVERSQHVRLNEVFRMGPLVRTLVGAAALAVSILVFAVTAREAFATWVHRVVLLDRDMLWPRANHVRVQGFPADRTLKVAKGFDFEVAALADLTGKFKLPENVQIRYHTADGTRGRDNMTAVGVAGPRDPDQKYAYVFKGVTSSIGFDVYGGDDRDRDYHIEVVDNPTISHMELACKYPEYTGRPANTVPASALVQLPQGTEVTISCETNKDLEQVVITQMVGDKLTTFADLNLSTVGDHRHFTTPMMVLNEDTTLLFELHDADGIRTRDPVRLVLAARADEIPMVALRLRGISSAITPQARLPVAGEAHDDYGLSRLWFEYQLDQSKNANRRVIQTVEPAPTNSQTDETAAKSTVPGEVDFRASITASDGRPRTQVEIKPTDGEALDIKRLAEISDTLHREGVKTPDDLAHVNLPEAQSLAAAIKTQEQLDQLLAFTPKVGQQLLFTLKAADNCTLGPAPNVGQGERYQLDIVPPEQLLSMLEGRELMLHQQFEVIYQEMLDSREALARIDFVSSDAKKLDDGKGAEPGDTDHPKGAEPGDKTNGDKGTDSSDPKRISELRDLRVARAIDNSDRSAHETLTVADSFDDIREEMINNRVDTPELQNRLKNQIADPLRHISVDMFPELRQRLTQLRQVLDKPAAGPEKLQAAVEQSDAILKEMKAVLDKMLELDTFNDVVEKLRDIISAQEQLNRHTQEKQKDLTNKLRGLQD
jgi:hypothetical protein